MRQQAGRRLLLRCLQWTLLLPCAAGLADAAGSGIHPAPAFTPLQLEALPVTGWLTNGGNLYNQRYSPLAQINVANVGKLQAKWRTHLAGSGVGAQYSGQGQPIVANGVIYISTGASDVFAVSVASGAILWRYTASLDAARVRACCGWINRGVALGAGMVFVGQLDAELVALDQASGRELWSVQTADPLKGYTITGAPLYYDGLVIIGFAGGEAGIRGHISAYDAGTGKLVWSFYTVPGPGEIGHDSWPADNDSWKYGGAPIWQTPAVDPQLGLHLLLHRQRRPRLQRRRARRRQPVHRVGPGAGSEDRQVPLALPAGAPRHLGLRLAQPGDPVRRALCRHHAQGYCGSLQDRLGVHPGS